MCGSGVKCRASFRDIDGHLNGNVMCVNIILGCGSDALNYLRFSHVIVRGFVCFGGAKGGE